MGRGRADVPTADPTWHRFRQGPDAGTQELTLRGRGPVWGTDGPGPSNAWPFSVKWAEELSPGRLGGAFFSPLDFNMFF